LRSLEDRLRPRAPEAAPLRDVACLGLLAPLTALMLLSWDVEGLRYVSDLAGLLASSYLLPALGVLLALRCGAIDLSIWVIFALGGAVPAALINAGVAVPTAVAAGVALGAGLGAVNGLLVAWPKLPSPVVTLAVAAAAMWTAQACLGGGLIRTPEETFDAWHISQQTSPSGQSRPQGGDEVHEPAGTGEGQADRDVRWLPISVARMLLVVAIYAAVMLAVAFGLVARRQGRLRLGPRGLLVVALAGSGALAGAGGALWLAEHGSAPVPTRLISDLRIPAAAVVAGGAFLGGPGRALLAGVYLPVAMLAVTIWRQQIGGYHAGGYDLHVLALAVMTLVAHPAAYGALMSRRCRRSASIAAGALTVGGIIALAVSAEAGMLQRATGLTWGQFSRPTLRTALSAIGIAAWAAGAALWLIARLRPGRQADTPPEHHEPV